MICAVCKQEITPSQEQTNTPDGVIHLDRRDCLRAVVKRCAEIVELWGAAKWIVAFVRREFAHLEKP